MGNHRPTAPQAEEGRLQSYRLAWRSVLRRERAHHSVKRRLFWATRKRRCRNGGIREPARAGRVATGAYGIAGTGLRNGWNQSGRRPEGIRRGKRKGRELRTAVRRRAYSPGGYSISPLPILNSRNIHHIPRFFYLDRQKKPLFRDWQPLTEEFLGSVK